MSDQVFCTVAELARGQDLPGVKDEALQYASILAACRHIQQKIGDFIPVTNTLTLDGSGSEHLVIPPMISNTEDGITNDGATVEDSALVYYGKDANQRRADLDLGCWTRLTFDPDAAGGRWSSKRDAVVIPGVWGLWSETLALNGMATLSDENDVSLVANRADDLSPGAVLLLGSEQVLVEASDRDNPVAATSLLDGATDKSQTEITVDDASEFYIGETLQIGVEDILIIARNIVAETIGVKRGINGTSKAAHVDDSPIGVYRTFTVKRGINGTTAAAQAGVAMARYVPPDDIRYLARQIAVLMLRKEQTGFAGKTGNAELGEVFYHNEFPSIPQKEAIKKYKPRRL